MAVPNRGGAGDVVERTELPPFAETEIHRVAHRHAIAVGKSREEPRANATSDRRAVLKRRAARRSVSIFRSGDYVYDASHADHVVDRADVCEVARFRERQPVLG